VPSPNPCVNVGAQVYGGSFEPHKHHDASLVADDWSTALVHHNSHHDHHRGSNHSRDGSSSSEVASWHGSATSGEGALFHDDARRTMRRALQQHDEGEGDSSGIGIARSVSQSSAKQATSHLVAWAPCKCQVIQFCCCFSLKRQKIKSLASSQKFLSESGGALARRIKRAQDVLWTIHRAGADVLFSTTKVRMCTFGLAGCPLVP